jgi:hypothetical protein
VFLIGIWFLAEALRHVCESTLQTIVGLLSELLERPEGDEQFEDAINVFADSISPSERGIGCSSIVGAQSLCPSVDVDSVPDYSSNFSSGKPAIKSNCTDDKFWI